MRAGGIGGTGPARWAYFKKVVAVPSLSKTGAVLRCGFFFYFSHVLILSFQDAAL